MRKKLKFDNFKRGDKVFCYSTKKDEELYKGVIARIAKSKDVAYIFRDDGHRTYGAPIIKGKRTYKVSQREDGTWNGYDDWENNNFTSLYFDMIDDWQATMKEVLKK